MMSFFSALPDILTPRGRKISLRDQFLDGIYAATKPERRDEDTALKTRIWRTPSGGRVELRFAFKQHGWNLAAKDHVIIARLVSQTPGKGHGDEAMAYLKREADGRGINLAMFARPIAHEAMPMEQLHRWLKKHDFHRQANPDDLYIRDPGGIDPAPAAAP